MQITEIPSWLGSAWGISVGVAQIILSITVILAVMLPVFLVARGKTAPTVYLILIFLIEAFLVGVGWMPFWILIGTILMGALAAAQLGSKAVTGG